MTKHFHALRLAPVAIAAALAFPATAVFAQETVTAQPVPVAGEPPAATPAPVIVLPSFSEPAPAPRVPAAEPAATAPVARTASPRAAPAPRPATTATAVKTASAEAAPAPSASVVPAQTASIAEPVAPAPLPVAEAPVATASPAQPSSDDRNTLALAGLAGILALSGAGIIWARRRWSVAAAETPLIDEPVATAPPVVPAPVIAPRPVAEPVSSPVQNYSPASVPTTAGALSHGLHPATAEGRRDLIERIVAAQPDESNPFRTRKARRHRARLIVQGMAATDARSRQPDSSDWSKPAPASAPQREFVDA